MQKGSTRKKFVSAIAEILPNFGDLFDEEGFYIFAVLVAVVTIVGAIIASRYIKLKDADPEDNDHEDWFAWIQNFNSLVFWISLNL